MWTTKYPFAWSSRQCNGYGKDVQSENHGNFHALLKFRVEAGDMILGQHLLPL